jgi:hypothetical protein
MSASQAPIRSCSEDDFMLPPHSARPTRLPFWPAFILLGALAGGLALRAADEARPAKAELPADLALVPPDAPGFFCFQVGPYWHGSEAEALKKIAQAHPVVITSWTQDLEKHIGLPVADLERAVVFFADLGKMGDFVAVLTTRKPFDRDKVLGTLVPDAKETKAGAKTYYTSEENPHGVAIVNNRTFLVGRAEVVRSFLARPAATGAGPLGEAIRAAAGKHLLVVGMVPTAFSAAVKNAGPQGKPFVPLMKANSWQIVVEADKDLRLNLRMTFASEEMAKEGQAALRAVWPPLGNYFEFCEKQMPPFLERESAKYPGVKDLAPRLEKTLQSARAGLKAFTTERKGTTVQGSVRVKTDEPVTAFVLLLSMAPRPAKQ